MKKDRKIWVEVFDSFFGDKKEEYHYGTDNTDDDKFPDEIKSVISKLQDMTDESFTKEEIDDIFKEEMGEPTEIIEYTKGNVDYTKKIWDKPEGKFVRIMASVKDGVDYKDLSLEEKLEITIQNEEYEKAEELKKEIENKKFIDNIDDEGTGNQEDGK